MTRLSGLCAALALVAAPAVADAGGLARPNGGTPRSVGMAGAFGAFADDATALNVNPAGLAYALPSALVALELVYAPRSYTCEGDNTVCGADPEGNSYAGLDQKAAALAPAPVLGVVIKPGGPDSDFAIAIGAWNTFGGILHWDEFDNPRKPAVDGSTELVFELAGGFGYRIDERFAIGAGIRLGFGLFGVKAKAKPVDTDLSAFGIGVGASAGVMIRPSSRLSIGAGWRSTMSVTTSGSGELVTSGPMNVDAEHVQQWPQSLALSAAYAATDQLVVAGQLDWTGWSRFESLDIVFPAQTNLNQHFDLDWSDTFTVRLGAQYRVSDKLAVRGGALRDGNAVPDRTIERQYLDSTKYSVSAGTSVVLSPKMALDVGVDAVFGPVRVVEDNSAEVAWPEQRNISPGEHSGQVFTLASGLRIAL
jgi:long-chain fatty acid transport protein